MVKSKKADAEKSEEKKPPAGKPELAEPPKAEPAVERKKSHPKFQKFKKGKT